LEQIRAAIQKAAPSATEAIKYGMPTFVLKGNLIHFAAYKNHIGIYPAPVAIEAFAKDFAPYKTSKGAVQLPIDKPMPLGLIAKVTRFRVKQMSEEVKPGKNKK
ncbi:MAG: DUF1801 domain-containing protein, partial [Bacteroidota bacterium]